MALHNVFSAPNGSPTAKPCFLSTASSPELPSVNDLLSRSKQFLPTQAAKDQRLPTRGDLQAGSKISDAASAEVIEIEDSSVVEIPADAVPRAPQNLKGLKKVPGPKAVLKHTASSVILEPRKKLKSKNGESQEIEGSRAVEDEETQVKLRAAAVRHAIKQQRKSAKDGEDGLGDPLHLEQAMTRKVDWTPPTQKLAIVLGSDSPELQGIYSQNNPSAQSFEELLQTYRCSEGTRRDPPAPTEDGAPLRGRRLIEMVAATTTKESPVVPAKVPEKPPLQRKASKKKPRTITELATAAYRAQTLEPAPTILTDVLNQTSQKKDGAGVSKEKGARKRVTKKKKKPSPPRKAILLPPTEALREVANQDFVFGTSSQLAVEKSPTFLRYLQTAMRESNQAEVIDLDTTLGSDVAKPRPKLWDAGARDEDGELFDLEMSNLNATTPNLSASLKQDDPFGYLEDGGNRAVIELEDDGATSAQGDDAADVSDELPSFGLGAFHLKSVQEVEVSEKGQFPSGSLSTGSPVRRIARPPASRPQKPADVEDDGTHDLDSRQSRPSYDFSTDSQLANEVQSYGFKPVKSRKAKIALLEQCWQSKSRPNDLGLGNLRTVTTTAGRSEKLEATTPEIKRPRGRPRKNSVTASEPAEPVTPEVKRPRGRPRKKSITASEPATPEVKRPRGRPRKNSITASEPEAKIPRRRPRKNSVTAWEPQEPPPSAQLDEPATPLRSATKKSSKVKKAAVKRGQKAAASEAPSTPKRKPRRIFSEIPDSASESGRSASLSPTPSPMADFSLSSEDEADATLALDPGDGQPEAFAYITKAVRSAPRTTNPAKPSWHEKMLLYDPIILEDLTAWLNAGQLGRVGHEGEVSVGEVKKWCESKSICCLLRKNCRGKERKL